MLRSSEFEAAGLPERPGKHRIYPSLHNNYQVAFLRFFQPGASGIEMRQMKGTSPKTSSYGGVTDVGFMLIALVLC